MPVTGAAAPGPLRWSGEHGAAAWGLTPRGGGASGGAAAGLNLGDHVGDDPAAVARNRALLLAALAPGVTRLVVPRQVHGREVVEVTPAIPGGARGGGPPGGAPDSGAPDSGAPGGDAPEADALVTTAPGTALAVVVADCVPVMLLDADPAPGGPVVRGVAHAGRRGMDLGVVGAAVAALRDLGARSPVAVLGPSACPRCYEVPVAMRDDVAGRHPVTASRTRSGTPSLDVAAGVLEQLADLGVPARLVGGCTVEDLDLFSVRRDGAATGRSAGVVWPVDAPGGARGADASGGARGADARGGAGIPDAPGSRGGPVAPAARRATDAPQRSAPRGEGA